MRLIIFPNNTTLSIFVFDSIVFLIIWTVLCLFARFQSFAHFYFFLYFFVTMTRLDISLVDMV